MISISKKIIGERWNALPDTLRDVVFSPLSNEAIDSIARDNHLSDIKSKKLSELCLYVLLGIINSEDLYKEIRDALQIDPRLALEIYHQVDKKIFESFKKEIEENYIKSKIGVIKESEIIEPTQVSSQVVLKEKNPEIVDLKSSLSTEPVKLKIEGDITSQKPKESAPISLDNLQANQSAQLPRGASFANMNVVRLATADTSFSQTNQSQKTFQAETGAISPKPQINQEVNLGQLSVGSKSNVSQPTASKPTIPEGPVILHKKEESQSIAQSQTIKNFAPSSFGGFFGSDMKSFGTAKTQNFVSSAKIEMPSQIKPLSSDQPIQKIPVVVKKYEEEPVKTVHISNFKTSLDNNFKTDVASNVPDNSKTSTPITSFNQPSAKSSVENKNNDIGGGMVDLSNLTMRK